MFTVVWQYPGCHPRPSGRFSGLQGPAQPHSGPVFESIFEPEFLQCPYPNCHRPKLKHSTDHFVFYLPSYYPPTDVFITVCFPRCVEQASGEFTATCKIIHLYDTVLQGSFAGTSSGKFTLKFS